MPCRWNDAARLRAHQIESGLDLTFSKVFVPYYADIVKGWKPESILEVGGGTGHLSHELARLTQQCVMIEPSQGMYSVARQTLSRTNVELHNVAVEAFHATSRQFDIVLSHLCVQTVGDLQPFLTAISDLISPSGRFLLSLPHPYFYNDYKEFFPRSGFHYIEERYASVSFSVTLDPSRAIEGVPYYHRPLSKYVAALAKSGLCVTLLDEIHPPEDIQALYGSAWENPRYLVIGGGRKS